MKRVKKYRLILPGLFVFFFIAALAFLSTANQDRTEAASTANFKAGNIISDAVMTDYNSMTVAEIQSFLKSKNSCDMSAELSNTGAIRYEDVNETQYGITYNRRYYFNTSSGVVSGLYHVKNGKFVCLADETINGQSAAYVIWDAAQSYQINPKVLIVLLEKEQSLITDKWPYHIQYRSATGYGCPDTAACDSKYYGLEAQLANAAYLFRTVMNGGWTNFPLGNNYIQYNPNRNCGGSQVNIENRATSALYRYTPYQPNAAALAAGYGTSSDGCGAYGNRNFYLLYSDWFGDARASVTTTVTSVDSAVPLAYHSHLQNIGWETGWRQEVTTSGTVGEARRLEAMQIKVAESSEIDTSSIHILYRSHLQNIGWETEWHQDGATTGTTGEARRLEAIAIKLDDASAKLYDIYYRSHVQDVGWLAWTRNGEPSGSEGYARRLEAIEIVIVKKGGAMPVSTNAASLKGEVKK